MIDVRIRYDHQATSVFLCEWPADDLDTLIPTIGAWGVHGDSGEHETADLVGQIRIDETSAYFEIVISTEDE